MTLTSPTFSQIKAQVAAIRRKMPDARAVGIHAAGRWSGQSEYRKGDDTYLITQCDSPLAMRIALRSKPDDDSTKVIVTSLEDRDIDDDIRLRLAKRRLHAIDNWQIVKSLFQAHAIDPRVSRNSWMAEELIRLMPSEGFAPAGGGFLDADRVWSILLRSYYGITSARPDLIALLVWVAEAGSTDRWRAAPAHVNEAAIEWITHSAGPLVPYVLQTITKCRPEDAIAIGLVLEVVFSSASAGKIERGIGKLEERYFPNGVPKAPLRQRWAEASAEVIRNHVTDRRARLDVLTRVDAIFEELGAIGFAHLSALSPTGFDQRLQLFAADVKRTLSCDASTSLTPVMEAHQRLSEHDRATVERRRMARSTMALRLLRWRHASKEAFPEWRSLTEASRHHASTGSYVDWARLTLRAGDELRDVSAAYSDLLAWASSLRDRHAETFARLVRDWTASGSSLENPVPVEAVLTQVVCPIARSHPVLLIVLDGLSFAVWRELQSDLNSHNWRVIRSEDTPFPDLSLATIPSVTQASRTTLLTGVLQAGGAAEEKQGFEAHAGLRAVCAGGGAPLLFHKAALTEAGDVSLATDVRNAIASTEHQVVGVVVNAIDDHLFKGEQIDVRWTRDEIRALPALLHEASLAGRLVVLLSDHGHILDHGTRGRRFAGEGGERWREDNSHCDDGEIQTQGDRILVATNKRLIALTTENVRYGSKRNGYHGGLTPQEMLIPISVISAAETLPSGWQEELPQYPDWWDTADARPTLVALPAVPEQASPETLFPEMVEELDTPPNPAVATWISALIASALFIDQKSFAGRTVPSDEDFTQLLAALDSRGGRMTTAALARVMSRPIHRLNGLLAVCQRVLNVDGYPVLSRDDTSDTVELKATLAKSQFGIED